MNVRECPSPWRCGFVDWQLVKRFVPCFCAVAAFALPGSQTHGQVGLRPMSGYVSPSVSHLRLTRALLLPVENQTQHKRFEETFQELLETELRSIQLFHVVDCPASACGELCVPQLCQGTFPMATIAELRKKYLADMIIATAITEFHPYGYPKVGVELHIIETTTAETIASFSGVWDSRTKNIAEQARQFFQTQSHDGPLCNPELVFQSPRYFSEFVTRDLAQGLAELWAGETGIARATHLRMPPDPNANRRCRRLPCLY